MKIIMYEDKLHKDTAYLLEAIIIFSEEPLNKDLTFRAPQIKRLIKILENPRIREFMDKIKIQHNEYIIGIQKLMSNKKSKELFNNNPWHTLGNLSNDMVWGNMSTSLKKQEQDIWHKINGFNFRYGGLEDIRFKIMILILIVFDNFGLEAIAKYLPILFTEPVYISSVGGLPNIQIREKLSFGQLITWLEKNKKMIEDIFKRFDWEKNTRETPKLLRDLKVVLMWHYGNKDKTIAIKLNTQNSQVHQVLNEYVRLNQ